MAGFPEGHILCPDRERDAEFLKLKIEAGADFIITQLFFENKDYFEYIDRLRRIGVDVRVIPGSASSSGGCITTARCEKKVSGTFFTKAMIEGLRRAAETVLAPLDYPPNRNQSYLSPS